MTNNQTNNCPYCNTAAHEGMVTENCTLVEADSVSIESILSVCINSEAFKSFQYNGKENDPCANCPHNQITVTPGTFIRMEDGPTENSWHEIHLCPTCQSTYSVSAISDR